MNKNKYFMDLAKEYGPIQLEKCFKNMAIDPILMKEIEGLGVFSKNQKYFLHEMVNRVIYFARKAFVNAPQKISGLKILCFGTWGSLPESDFIHHIGKYDDIIYSELLKDYKDLFQEGTIMGSINDHPFPAVEESYIYRELLYPDNYDAPHHALEFVNAKLSAALPGYNLWCKALDLDVLNIYDLDKLPHMKTYYEFYC